MGIRDRPIHRHGKVSKCTSFILLIVKLWESRVHINQDFKAMNFLETNLRELVQGNWKILAFSIIELVSRLKSLS